MELLGALILIVYAIVTDYRIRALKEELEAARDDIRLLRKFTGFEDVIKVLASEQPKPKR